MASEIQREVVNLTLRYLSPLDTELPPHLVSKALLQRHHFLGLSPNEPEEYLCWSANGGGGSGGMEGGAARRAVELLEGVAVARAGDEYYSDEVRYPVRYTADDEYTYAHVHVTSADRGDEGLRLVFQWDPESRDSPEGGASWKYHDAKLMPFPPQASSSLPGAATSIPQTIPQISYTHSQPWNRSATYNDDGDDQSDDDAYWNQYTMGDDSSRPRSIHRDDSSDDKGEDAYWAQYSNVQGTADSTIPSPHIPTRRKLPDPYAYEQPESFDHIAVPIVSSEPGHLSPNNLALRLTGLSPRLSPQPYAYGSASPTPASQHEFAIPVHDNMLQFDTGEDAARIDIVGLGLGMTQEFFEGDGQSQSDSSPTMSPPGNERGGEGVTNGLNIATGLVITPPRTLGERSPPPRSPLDEGLKASIQGLYQIWSSGRTPSISGEESKRQFMEFVGAALV